MFHERMQCRKLSRIIRLDLISTVLLIPVLYFLVSESAKLKMISSRKRFQNHSKLTVLIISQNSLVSVEELHLDNAWVGPFLG